MGSELLKLAPQIKSPETQTSTSETPKENDVTVPPTVWQLLGSVVQKTTQHSKISAKDLQKSKENKDLQVVSSWNVTLAGLKWSSGERRARSFCTEVKHQQDNWVPWPKPINIPSCTALSLLSDQHTHKLHRQPCWWEINLPIVCEPWLHRDASLGNTIWFDCFGPATRKTTHRRTKTK